jgi:hypothetical protein
MNRSTSIFPKIIISCSTAFTLVMALYLPSKSVYWAIAGAGSATGAAVGMVQGTKNQRRYNELERKLSAAKSEIYKADKRIKQSESQAVQIGEMTAQISALEVELKSQKSFTATAENALKTLQGKSASVVLNLQSQVEATKAECSKLQEEITTLKNALQDNLDEWDESMHLKASELSQKLAERELQELHSTWDSRINSLVKLFQDLTGLFEISSERQEMLKHGFVTQDENFSSQKEDLRNQLEMLVHESSSRTGQLEAEIHQLKSYQEGIYLEPVYLEKQFNSLFQAANGVIRLLHEDLGITVKALGAVANNSGDCKVGVQLSKSLEPISTLKVLNEQRKRIQNSTLLPVIDPFKWDEVTNTVTFTIRQSARLASVDRSKLYRSSEDFLKAVLGGRLFIRLVGTPGSGKTPTVAVLISKILEKGFSAGNMPSGAKLPHLKIEMCNPLQGVSVKNSDEVLDTFTTWDSATEALKGLGREYQHRKDLASKVYRESSGYLWICDEFDNAIAGMTASDLEGFGKLLKDGGHMNMGAVVLGQAVNVSKSKLSIEDQKMFTNVLLDGVSIRTFLESYGSKFYSEDAIEKAKRLYEEIEKLMESDNAMISDSARQLRVGLVLAEKSPVFYELPYFDGVEIDSQAYQENLKMLAEKSAKPAKSQNGMGTSQTAQNPFCQAETLIDEAMAELPKSVTAQLYGGLNVLPTNGTRPTCKKHPTEDLRVQSDSRYYCPGCKKRVAKKDLNWS